MTSICKSMKQGLSSSGSSTARDLDSSMQSSDSLASTIPVGQLPEDVAEEGDEEGWLVEVAGEGDEEGGLVAGEMTDGDEARGEAGVPGEAALQDPATHASDDWLHIVPDPQL